MQNKILASGFRHSVSDFILLIFGQVKMPGQLYKRQDFCIIKKKVLNALETGTVLDASFFR